MPYADRERQLSYWKEHGARKRAARPRHECACGCGQMVARKWAVGHNRLGAQKHPIPGERRCFQCKEAKPLAEFYRSKQPGKNGHSHQCAVCAGNAVKKRYKENDGRSAAEERRFREYGITRDWYEQQVIKQDGLCAICRDPSRSHDKKKLYVDHCHATGVVRGLLCHACNAGIGHLADDIARIHRAREYVQHFAARAMAAYPNKPSLP